MKRKIGAILLIFFFLFAHASAQEVVGPLAFSVSDIDWSNPLLRGITNWWYIIPTLAGGPKWYDIRGFKHGTLTNMTAGFGFEPSNKDEWFGEMRFGGTDDYINVPADTAFDFVNTTFTVVGWFRATSCPSSCYLLVRRNNALGGAWFIRVNSTGTFNVRLDSNVDTALDHETTDATMIDGNWRRFVAVITTNTTTTAGNTGLTYINGVLTPATDWGPLTGVYMAPGATPLYFGAHQDGAAGYLIGALQDIRIYNRGWSAAEAAADYMFYRASLAQIVGAPHSLFTQIILALFFPRRLPHVYQ